jgi:hypothetical protein
VLCCLSYIRHSDATEFIGQDVGYSEPRHATIRKMTINSLNLSRLDEDRCRADETQGVAGRQGTIERFRPIIIVERLKASRKSSPRCWQHTAMNGSRLG